MCEFCGTGPDCGVCGRGNRATPVCGQKQEKAAKRDDKVTAIAGYAFSLGVSIDKVVNYTDN